MANRRNNWKGLLELANNELKEFGYEIIVTFDNDDGTYSVEIFDGVTSDNYADNYYEDELVDLVMDAWAYANKKRNQ